MSTSTRISAGGDRSGEPDTTEPDTTESDVTPEPRTAPTADPAPASDPAPAAETAPASDPAPEAETATGSAGIDREPAFAWRAHRRRATIAWLLGTLLVAGALTWLVAFSPVLGVRTVDVRGVRAVSAGDIRRAAAIPRGMPLVRLNTAAVARRVERLPAVRSASVQTSLPSTVTIRVLERTAVGYLERSRGSAELVDRAGVRFRAVSSAPDHLPQLAVPSGTQAGAGIAAVASVAAALPADIRTQVRSIQALDASAVTLVLPNSVVRWGAATRNAAKVIVLAPLLKTGASQIDVTDPLRPFTRD